MSLHRLWPLAVGFVAVATAWSSDFADTHPVPMLVNTCLIAKNVKQLVEFHEPILGLKAKRSGED